MSHFVAQKVNYFQSKIMNHRGRLVGWAKQEPGRTWHLYGLNGERIAHKRITSPEDAAIVMQSL